MQPFEPSRRLLFKTLLASAFTSGSAFASTTSSSRKTDQYFISGAVLGNDQAMGVVFDQNGNIMASVPLSARAHGAASHAQTQQACLFARRPGMYMNAFDIRSPQKHHSISPVEGRHFYGHGAYSQDGKMLFATENDFEAAKGVLGIYDTQQQYKRITEVPSGGMGPHDVIGVPGSPLLVIANGGIETHPDTGRDKLNIDSMQPAISIIDSRDGKLVGQHYLPDELHQMSIRHLACDTDEVWFASQYEGTNPMSDGLAGVISLKQSISSFNGGKSSKGLELIDVPATLQMQAQHYMSSVAIAGDRVIYTAARGSLAFTVNRKTRQLEELMTIFDCSGVATAMNTGGNEVSAHNGLVNCNKGNAQNGLVNCNKGNATENFANAAIITTGSGSIMRTDKDDQLVQLAQHSLHWDNHVYPMSRV